jgi:hypothetical protein
MQQLEVKRRAVKTPFQSTHRTVSRHSQRITRSHEHQSGNKMRSAYLRRLSVVAAVSWVKSCSPAAVIPTMIPCQVPDLVRYPRNKISITRPLQRLLLGYWPLACSSNLKFLHHKAASATLK